ncbi:MAG: helix-turn-helix domain-containing protein [Myxococcales bacterium]|nr:helix-turn-helix domain-containing protein [Myxococcales bacterium]MCB9648723.1 helix-turn-helix domain-containing protein [Deltaproteobacteria bacterium]
MQYLEAVQAGIEFIEARLEEDIDLAEVAAAARMSQWHFQRIFKGLTRETLMAYVRARRMARALERLQRTDDRIIEIALGAGFESQASFTRAFKKTYGLTPAAYRRLGGRNPFPKKLRADRAYLEHLQARVTLEPEIVAQPALRLVGLRTRFFGSGSEKNNVAAQLPGLWAAFLPRLGEISGRVPGVCYGVVGPAVDGGEELEYHAVAEVSAQAELPPGMVELVLPAATWARFLHRGPPEALDHTVDYVYSAWLLASARRHTFGPDLEIYGPAYAPGSETSEIGYAIPIG